MTEQRVYIAIDLKSFYASVECVERGLDPLATNLVVADIDRTEKTICLAVSPSLKAYGISGRARLFEVVQRVQEVNYVRRRHVATHALVGKSYSDPEVKANDNLALDYIVAKPRMSFYIQYSARIYNVYLRYIAPEDIHVYSIDEVFFDATNYLKIYNLSAHQLAMKMVRAVLRETGITATAGIGTNLYLAKIAMDIVAKHKPADKDGVRIAELDEQSYRRLLWDHKPLTSFWRVGHGLAAKLESYGMYTMGQIARCSINNEELLYKLFGVNAELLIDHAWGWEPCTIEAIKSYRPKENSLCTGQVLQEPYTFKKARVVAKEMADSMALDLVDKHLVTDQIVVTVGYDIENLTNPSIQSTYNGPITTDGYGRRKPKSVHGSANLGFHNSSSKLITLAVIKIFDQIVSRNLLIRRMNVTANHVVSEDNVRRETHAPIQLNLFTNGESQRRQEAERRMTLSRERRMQQTLLNIKKKFGKNAILKGIDFEEGATTRERNIQIGGHRA
ncbi:DNA methylase [Prevotella sp. S7-1-8]|uniref:Y-family DNA polymerase n=1 Tax=Prevotella sp. S7-1-8 TaxID=1284775 RepID=UPI00050F1F63|nr:DNA methylase [Prevotella sp. S7-1-8]KGF18641.1 DNA methylase [Prevotella sp. S7-1-8]